MNLPKIKVDNDFGALSDGDDDSYDSPLTSESDDETCNAGHVPAQAGQQGRRRSSGGSAAASSDATSPMRKTTKSNTNANAIANTSSNNDLSRQFSVSADEIAEAMPNELLSLSTIYDSSFKYSEHVSKRNKTKYTKIFLSPLNEDHKPYSLTLSMRLTNGYPFGVPPRKIKLLDVKGFTSHQVAALLQSLKKKGRELTDAGAVVVMDMGQLIMDLCNDLVEDSRHSSGKDQKSHKVPSADENLILVASALNVNDYTTTGNSR